MKIFKFALRIWITISSVAVFLTSWMLFGHSPKPVNSSQTSAAQSVVATPLPTLAPLDSMPGLAAPQFSGLQLSTQNNRQSPPASIFVTGGS